MEILNIRKRDGELQKFDLNKIEYVIKKALDETEEENIEATVGEVTSRVYKDLLGYCSDTSAGEDHCRDGIPTVEEIQDIVERAFMELGYFDTAKAFILYRQQHNKKRNRDIFKKRTNLKPYEYPELEEYVDAIRHSYWIHTEFNYTSDVQDFKVNVTDPERDAIRKAMLAIAQIEVAVKVFWGDLYKKMPKPEIGAVGFTFAESEVRHMNAYSHLLEILGLNDEFKEITSIPVMKERITYLETVIAMSKSEDDREFSLAVLLFSLFVEHVSLFSQFLIIMSFNKHKNLFKGISNAVEATSKEEQIHGLFGIDLINIIREEHPEWFDGELKDKVEEMCIDAYEAECKIIDWIFESGELEMMPKHVVKEFVKHRLNNSLRSIGFTPVFVENDKLVDETDWFENEVIATKHVDFFNKKSINYNKRSASVTSDDLFD